MLSFKLYDKKIIISNYSISLTNSVKKSSFNTRNYINESVSRAKRKIYDLGLCNSWSHFITMTFDKKKINRFNLNEVKTKFIKYLKNYSRIDKDFKYLVIPELHKNGALHFHGLVFFGDNSMKYLKWFKKNIFNHQLFSKTFGFNRFIKITYKSDAIITYIVKYVSKDISKLFRNYYFRSNNLKEPLKFQIKDNFIISNELKKIEPLFCCETPGLNFYQNSFVSSFVINSNHELYNFYYIKYFKNNQVEREKI